MLTNIVLFGSKLSVVVFIMLINAIMPKVVDILTFMSMINFILSIVEHEKKFYSLGARIRDFSVKYMQLILKAPRKKCI